MEENNDIETNYNQPASLIQKSYRFLKTYRNLSMATIFGFPIIILFVYPYLAGMYESPAYMINSMTLIFIFAAMTLTLNLEVGYLGLPNFGKVAFFAVGGYTYAISRNILVVENGTISETDFVFIGMVLSILVTSLFGVLLTLPTLKLREDYLAIVTIVAGEMIRRILINEEELGGFLGFFVTKPINLHFIEMGFSPRTKMAGVFLDLVPFIGLILIIGLSHWITNMLIRNQGKEFALKRGLTVFFTGTIILLFLDFKMMLGDDGHLGLHILILAFTLLYVSYNSFGRLNQRFDYHILFISMYAISLGSFILNFISQPESTIGLFNWFTMMFAFYSMIFIYIIMEELYYAPFGRTLRAIREDETSAISVGKSVFDYRLKALVVAAALSGFVGVLYVIFALPIVNPFSYQPLLTFLLYIMLIIGGRANNKGVIYGAVIIQMLFQVTKGTLFADRDWSYPNGRDINMENIGIILTGVMLILFLIYAPDGIFPEVKNNNERYYNMLADVEKLEKEQKEDSLLLQKLISLSNADMEKEGWI